MLGTIITIIVIVIIGAFVKLEMDHRKYSRRSNNQASSHQPTMYYGCLHPGECKHKSLGDPAMQGRNSDTYCYCKKRNKVVERVANCPDFLSPGCDNDFCRYATQDHQNHTVFCSRFNATYSPQDSCPYFEKSWETIDGIRRLAKNLQDSHKN